MYYSLNVIPVEECNLRCKFCFEDTFSGKKINIEKVQEFLQTFDTYRKNHDTARVVIFGGEPTLDLPLLQQIYTECDKYDWIKDVYLITNLQCGVRELLNHTKTRHQKYIQVGITSVRGVRGEVDKALLLREHFDLKINTVITPDNHDDVMEIFHWILDNNLEKAWQVGVDRAIIHYEDVADSITKTFKDIIDVVFERDDIPEISGIHSFFHELKGCDNGYNTFTLGANGLVCGCCHIPFMDITKRQYPEDTIEFMKRDDVYVPISEWKLQPVACMVSHDRTPISSCPIFSDIQTGHPKIIEDVCSYVRRKVEEKIQKGVS